MNKTQIAEQLPVAVSACLLDENEQIIYCLEGGGCTRLYAVMWSPAAIVQIIEAIQIAFGMKMGFIHVYNISFILGINASN